MTTFSLPADVVIFIKKHFPAEEHRGVVELLASAKQPDGSPADVRMLRCVLFNSGKTVLGLSFEVDWLKSDPRDVFQNAECARRDGSWVQVRDLSQPFAADA